MIKRSTRIMHWFYKLSWKKVMGLGMFLLTIGALPLARQAAINPTRTRSEAALLPVPQVITDKFETPKGPPNIYLVDHFFGKTGDAVLIWGENLGGLHNDSWVSLGGKKIELDNLVIWTGSYIDFKVPDGANSGMVETSVLGKRTSWPGMFFVTNETTKAELRLTNEDGGKLGKLMAKNIEGGNKLLLWMLVINGEDDLSFQTVGGVKIKKEESFSFPVGKVYELELDIDKSLTLASSRQLVELLQVTKRGDFGVGVARAELSTPQGGIIPLQLHPLYVSF